MGVGYYRTWFCVNCRILIEQANRPVDYPTLCRYGVEVSDEAEPKRKIRTDELERG
jgi:hypothetical protein